MFVIGKQFAWVYILCRMSHNALRIQYYIYKHYMQTKHIIIRTYISSITDNTSQILLFHTVSLISKEPIHKNAIQNTDFIIISAFVIFGMFFMFPVTNCTIDILGLNVYACCFSTKFVLFVRLFFPFWAWALCLH